MLIVCTVTLLLSTCLWLAVVPSPKQAEPTLRGCTLASGAVPLCLEWRQEMRQEKAPKNVVFMLPTFSINFLPWDHEKGKHCIQWKDVYHQHETRLSWEKQLTPQEMMLHKLSYAAESWTPDHSPLRSSCSWTTCFSFNKIFISSKALCIFSWQKQ